MPLVSAKDMIKKAFDENYAVAQINTNNLEWTKVILETAQSLKSPIIIGTSEGAIKYMGGLKTIYGLVTGMIFELGIKIPVALHLDHGTYETGFKALKAGYTSVMYDGSHEDFAVNYENSRQIIFEAFSHGASVELEVGTLAGEEDGVIGAGDVADPKEVMKISKLEPTMIAAGINNIHGPYPENWTGLRFDVLSQLKEAGKTPLVLHGGTGIPEEQVLKSISMGVAKINVNTELQLANAKAVKEFVTSGKIDEGKNYDPRKLLAPGYEAMKKVITEKLTLFGSVGKA